MHVYVITASKHGSTREIGAAIAERLREFSHAAIAMDVSEVGALDKGSAIVLGSPIYMGKWMKPARELLEQLAAEEPGRLVFTFTVGPIGDPPQPDDAKPEEEVEHFNTERASNHRMFTGKLDGGELGRLERLAAKAVKAPDGDYRDWVAVKAWADEISDELIAAQAPPAGVGPHVRD